MVSACRPVRAAHRCGTVDVNEFFRWTLTRNLKGLEEIFRRYDDDGVGNLDLIEFSRVADDMGFGAVAHELFVSRTSHTCVPEPYIHSE